MRAIYLALTLGLAVATIVPTTTSSTSREETNPLISKRDRHSSIFGSGSGNVFEDYYGLGSSKIRNPLHNRGVGSVSELEEEEESVFSTSHVGGGRKSGLVGGTHHSTTGTSKFTIDVDEDEINEIIRDFKEFGYKYITRTKAERIALMNKLKLAFKNTAAKLILNFGKTIPPLVQSWATVMKHVQVNDKCDQNCAVKCLDPKAGCDSMYFNPRCLASCNCKFDIETVNPKVLRTKVDDITRNAENVSRFFKGVNTENMRLIKPSLDAYLNKASDLHMEFGELLREHAAKVLGCDEECIDDCLNPNFVSFWEIPMCVKSCKCQQGLINIQRESSPFYHESSSLDIFGITEEEKGTFVPKSNVHQGASSRFGKITSLFSNILGSKSDIERLEESEEEEELLGKEHGSHHVGGKGYSHHLPPVNKEEWIMKKGGLGRKYERDLNIPELMRYSEYDPKAWAFFKRYEEDI